MGLPMVMSWPRPRRLLLKNQPIPKEWSNLAGSRGCWWVTFSSSQVTHEHCLHCEPKLHTFFGCWCFFCLKILTSLVETIIPYLIKFQVYILCTVKRSGVSLWGNIGYSKVKTNPKGVTRHLHYITCNFASYILKEGNSFTVCPLYQCFYICLKFLQSKQVWQLCWSKCIVLIISVMFKCPIGQLNSKWITGMFWTLCASRRLSVMWQSGFWTMSVNIWWIRFFAWSRLNHWGRNDSHQLRHV